MNTDDTILRLAELQKSSYQHKRQWLSAQRKLIELPKHQQNLAIEGINRHLDACAVTNLPADYMAVLEIIMDAKDNRQIWKETDKQFTHLLGKESNASFKARLNL